MKKRGLGQGLSSLLGAEAAYDQKEGFREVYTSQLLAGDSQPRTVFTEDELEQLAVSIESNGILQPLIVRQLENNQYEIIAGERRWRAAKKIGLDRVPVLVRDLTDEEAQAVALVENVQRENLTPMEEARGYARIMKKMNISQEEAARMVGKTRVHVANTCRLLSLPEAVQEMVDARALTPGHARTVVGLENAVDVATLIAKKKMSVRRAEVYVQKLKGKGEDQDMTQGTVLAEKTATEGVAFGVESFVAPDPPNQDHLTPDEKQEIEQIEGFLSSRMGCDVRVLIGYNRHQDIKMVFELEDRAQLDDILSKISAISSN
ncbi:MAG: ParB/RepB/Spo0J family partition protein [Holosporaceae bacterium]|nr:MAG: ParB/RepB/Spo0J family partition protein [Holosporaceae bacterium]